MLNSMPTVSVLRIPAWLLLLASFSSLVRAAYCAPVFPVSVKKKVPKQTTHSTKKKGWQAANHLCLRKSAQHNSQQTSFFRHWRIARSTSLHVPKNFRTLCWGANRIWTVLFSVCGKDESIREWRKGCTSLWHCLRRLISSLHSSVCRWGERSGCMLS